MTSGRVNTRALTTIKGIRNNIVPQGMRIISLPSYALVSSGVSSTTLIFSDSTGDPISDSILTGAAVDGVVDNLTQAVVNDYLEITGTAREDFDFIPSLFKTSSDLTQGLEESRQLLRDIAGMFQESGLGETLLPVLDEQNFQMVQGAVVAATIVRGGQNTFQSGKKTVSVPEARQDLLFDISEAGTWNAEIAEKIINVRLAELPEDLANLIREIIDYEPSIVGEISFIMILLEESDPVRMLDEIQCEFFEDDQSYLDLRGEYDFEITDTVEMKRVSIPVVHNNLLLTISKAGTWNADLAKGLINGRLAELPEALANIIRKLMEYAPSIVEDINLTIILLEESDPVRVLDAIQERFFEDDGHFLDLRSQYQSEVDAGE